MRRQFRIALRTCLNPNGWPHTCIAWQPISTIGAAYRSQGRPRKRWDDNLLNTFRESPWDLKAVQVQELPADRQLQPIPQEAGLPPPAMQDRAIEKRDFKIFKHDIQTYGGTANPVAWLLARV